MTSSKYFKYTNEQKELLLSKFGRTVESIKEDVTAIKLWLEKQPHLPKILDDCYIEHFLVSNKFVFNNAKKSIDWYFRIKNIYPAYFKEPDEPNMVIALNQFYLFPLPKLTPSNCRVVVMKLRKTTIDPSFNACSFIAQGINVADLALNYDCPAPKVIVYDSRDHNIEYVARFSPSTLKALQIIFQKAFHNSIQEMHGVNVNPVLEGFLNLVKSFMNPKVASRIKVHKDISSLYEFIPKEILPKDYGGNEKSFEELHEMWKDELTEKLPWFKQRKFLVSNESLRTEKVPDCDLLGYEGNFRKLNLD